MKNEKRIAKDYLQYHRVWEEKRRERNFSLNDFRRWRCWWWWARGKNRVQKHVTRSLRQQQHMSLLSIAYKHLPLLPHSLAHNFDIIEKRKRKTESVWLSCELDIAFANVISLVHFKRQRYTWTDQTNKHKTSATAATRDALTSFLHDRRFSPFFLSASHLFIVCATCTLTESSSSSSLWAASQLFCVLFSFLNKLLNGIKNISSLRIYWDVWKVRSEKKSSWIISLIHRNRQSCRRNWSSLHFRCVLQILNCTLTSTKTKIAHFFSNQNLIHVCRGYSI